jgi:hypothetical protein
MKATGLWLRLLLASAAFLGWIAYLAYLVVARPQTPEEHPLVVSRAQLLGSDADVIAVVDDPGKPVKIEKVLWAGGEVALAVGQVVTVANIERAQARAASKEAADPPKDYTGPGRYLIPLRYHPISRTFSVAAVPASPGFGPPPFDPNEDRTKEAEPAAWSEPATRWPVYRIYPATEEAEAQYARYKPGQ